MSLSGCTHRISPNKAQDGAEAGCASFCIFTHSVSFAPCEVRAPELCLLCLNLLYF